MIKLLKKEVVLSMHPTVPLMIMLSAMVLIPNYPYSVMFFYLALSIFFTCLLGRETNDITYSMMLPIAKRDIVKARITFSLIVEAIQFVFIIPFMLLSQAINVTGNQAGMDPNIALFGIGFLIYGTFNLIFFTGYYKNVTKVGVSFIIASTIVFLLVVIEVVSTYAVPFVRDRLDTADPNYMTEKILFVAVCFVIFVIMTIVTFKKSIQNFDRLDIQN